VSDIWNEFCRHAALFYPLPLISLAWYRSVFVVRFVLSLPWCLSSHVSMYRPMIPVSITVHIKLFVVFQVWTPMLKVLTRTVWMTPVSKTTRQIHFSKLWHVAYECGSQRQR
jgi:hypothetical protein